MVLSMNRKIHIGVVGLGAFSSDFIKLFGMHPDVEEVAVCDLLPERVAKSRKEHGIKRGFTSFDEMLKCKDLDSIAIFTQRHLHAKMV